MSIYTDPTPPADAAVPRRRSVRTRFFLASGRPRRRTSVALWLAVTWLVVMVLAAILAGMIPIQGYDAADFNHVRQGPGLRWPQPLGTDGLGRSELSRVIY